MVRVWSVQQVDMCRRLTVNVLYTRSLTLAPIMDQQFCLRWNNHPNNLTDVLASLLQREALCDVTLACDGETVKGEVNVGQNMLPMFLKTAESLQVRGLTENSTLNPKQSHLKSVKGGSTGSGSEPSTPPPAHTPQRLARSPAHTPHVKQEPDSPYPALPPPLPPSHYEQTHLPSLEWRESDGAAGADAHKPAPVDLCVQPRIGTILASILALPNQQIDTAKTAKQTHTPVRKGGRFRTNWLTLYPWLQYDEMQNIMFCNVCRKWAHELTVTRTSFIEGNANFRLEIVNHHDKCKAHRFCQEREHSRRDLARPNDAIS
ncbi:hypothetical protein MSG28_008101 [Choristoneura fumiferana]|uniref:Uncharacterized protein n=2 Tax=Choristoneura fumiferana TaxID=7141 RepID=A0ACC0JA03_CHOFU|nr:hypothetical protein MSG28_008101 [Choristoneura fumiferana]KAI8420952.1 hypothetical protein MSG28_008101 [Choristoneura fumiferana]